MSRARDCAAKSLSHEQLYAAPAAGSSIKFTKPHRAHSVFFHNYCKSRGIKPAAAPLEETSSNGGGGGVVGAGDAVGVAAKAEPLAKHEQRLGDVEEDGDSSANNSEDEDDGAEGKDGPVVLDLEAMPSP